MHPERESPLTPKGDEPLELEIGNESLELGEPRMRESGDEPLVGDLSDFTQLGGNRSE